MHKKSYFLTFIIYILH